MEYSEYKTGVNCDVWFRYVHYFYFTMCMWSSKSSPGSYLGDPRFKSWPEDQLRFCGFSQPLLC